MEQLVQQLIQYMQQMIHETHQGRINSRAGEPAA